MNDITAPTAAEARYHLRYVTVSPDFKIQEACRAMRMCRRNAEAANTASARIDFIEYAQQWQAIAISWASR